MRVPGSCWRDIIQDSRLGEGTWAPVISVTWLISERFLQADGDHISPPSLCHLGPFLCFTTFPLLPFMDVGATLLSCRSASIMSQWPSRCPLDPTFRQLYLIWRQLLAQIRLNACWSSLQWLRFMRNVELLVFTCEKTLTPSPGPNAGHCYDIINTRKSEKSVTILSLGRGSAQKCPETGSLAKNWNVLLSLPN